MSAVPVPDTSTVRTRSEKCDHLDVTGDSTIVVNPDGRAWCERCGEGLPYESIPEAADRLVREADEEIAKAVVGEDDA